MNRLFFRGTSGSTDYYAVFLRMRDHKMWRVSDNAWIDLVDDQWDGTAENLDVALTESNVPATDGPLNSYYVDVPSHANFGAGAYVMLVYDKFGGTPNASNSVAGVFSDTADYGNACQYFLYDGEDIVENVYDVLVDVVRNGSTDHWSIIPRINGKAMSNATGVIELSSPAPTLKVVKGHSTPTVLLNDVAISAASFASDRRSFYRNETSNVMADNQIYIGHLSVTIHGEARILPFIVKRVA